MALLVLSRDVGALRMLATKSKLLKQTSRLHCYYITDCTGDQHWMQCGYQLLATAQVLLWLFPSAVRNLYVAQTAFQMVISPKAWIWYDRAIWLGQDLPAVACTDGDPSGSRSPEHDPVGGFRER